VTWIVLANIPNSISSLIVSTRIFSSIVFGRANRALLAEAHSDGGGGCIACDRNEEEECFSTHLEHGSTAARRAGQETGPRSALRIARR